MFSSAQGATLVVDDLGDPSPTTGNLTLRNAIAGANPGDTVLIGISGTIVLTGGPITVSNGITISGPEPIHLTIDANGGLVFDLVVAGATINFSGFSVTNTGGSNFGNGAITVGGGVTLNIKYVVFDGGTARAIYNSSGVVNATSCSFIGLTDDSDGGAYFQDNGSNATFVNCTFGQNQTTGAAHGGAMYILGGTLNLINNSFVSNIAGGTGGAVQNFAGTVNFKNTLIYNNDQGTGDQFSAGGAATYNSQGGNYTNNSSATSWTLTGTDQQDPLALNVGISATVKTDGYGYKYYPINSDLSDLVDEGVAVTHLLDCRRVLRELHGSAVNVKSPDIGAMEFTPFVVQSLISLDTWDLVYSDITSTTLTPPYAITFNISGTPPFIVNTTNTYFFSDEVHIHGYTQPGSKIAGPGNSAGVRITPASIAIKLDGNGGLGYGIWLGAGSNNSTISGMAIYDFPNAEGVLIDASNVHIYGCHFGIDESGSIWPNARSIHLASSSNTASNCVIGGDKAWHNNCVAGSSDTHIYFDAVGGNDNNHVFNNFIGTTPDGLAVADANQTPTGIGIFGGQNNRIGDGGVHAFFSGNLISGNNRGIQVLASNVQIHGNLIGTDIHGVADLGNTNEGINCTSNNTISIGNSSVYRRNIISGNGSHGILLNASSDVVVQNNIIGLDINGVTTLTNGGSGITIYGNSRNCMIGGVNPSQRNILTGNTQRGMYMSDCDSITVVGNYVGLDLPGTNAIGNGSSSIPGIQLLGNVTNTIFGQSGAPNIIVGHLSTGLSISNSGNNGNKVVHNYIGVGPDGITAMANQTGLNISAVSNTVVGQSSGLGNVISGNVTSNINITNPGPGNVIIGNHIGPDVSGTVAVGSTNSGIYLTNNTTNIMRIGGSNTGEGNLISGNGTNGLFLSGPYVDVIGNKIGTDITGTSGLANQRGVYITHPNIRVGGTNPGEGNIIAFNSSNGVSISGATAVNNSILGNSIFNNGAGTMNLGIDLIPAGVTTNDANDIDNGPNEMQNYPALGAATTNCGGTTFVSTNLHTTANTTLRIEYFTTDPIYTEPNGHGEGQNYVTAIIVTTDASGNYDADVDLGTLLPVGHLLTATATPNVAGSFVNTSEFSNYVAINDAPTFTGGTYVQSVSCNGANDGEGAFEITNGSQPFTYSWSNSAATDTAINLGPGSYSLTVADNAGCTINSPTSITITEPAALTATETHSDPLCNGASDGNITITASGGTLPYQYSIDNGVTSQTSNSFATGAGTYQPYVIDNNGCTVSLAAVTLTDPPVLIVDSVITTDISCNGFSDGEITIYASGGTAPYVYSINNGISFNTPSTYTNLDQDSYGIQVQDANGCLVNFGAVTINEPAALMHVINPSNPSCDGFCDGQIDFVSITGGISPYQTSIDGGVTYATNTVYTNQCAGTYNSWVQDANGCTHDQSFLLVDPTREDSSFNYNGLLTFCTGSGFYTPVITGTGGGTFTINQTGISINASTGQLDLNTATYTGNATVTYVTPCGISGDLNILIANPDDASFDYNGTVIFCDSDPDPAANITGGGTGTFSGATGLTFINTTTGLIDLSASTPGNYWVVFTTNGACPDMDSINITIASPGIAAFDGGQPVTFCENDADYTFTASPAGGTFSGPGMQSTGLFQPAVAGPGTYTLTYTVGATGCQSSDNITVVVNPAPVANMSGGGTFCSGDTPPDVFIDFSGGTLPFTYDLLLDGNFVSTSTATSFSETLSGLGNSGTYTITNITNNEGCVLAVGIGSAVITEVLPPSAPTISPGDTSYCLGETFATHTATPAGTGSVNWYDDAALTNLVSVGPIFLPSISTAGTYTYYAAETENGCTGAATAVTIDAFDAPTQAPTAITPQNINYCDGSSIFVMIAQPNGNGTIVWYDDQGNALATGNNYNPGPQLPFGSYVFYAAEVIGTCEGPSITYNINVLGQASVDAGEDVVICPGDSVQLNASGGISYEWINNGFISDTTVANPFVSPPVSTTYYAVISIFATCSYIDSVFVEVDDTDCGARPFNAFSPDGDGINDLWVIENLPANTSVSVKIFNRWGDILQSLEGYNNFDVVWDGTDRNNKPLPAGTYFYLIEVQDGSYSKTGWVQLMK